MVDTQSTSIIPAPKGGIVESEELLGEELFLYDEASGEVHILNSGAAMIWLLCDGDRDLEKISHHIAPASNISWEQVLPWVQQTIAQFHDFGLLEEFPLTKPNEYGP